MGISDRLKKFENAPDIVETTPFSEFIADALANKVASIPVWYDYDYSKQFELILNFLDNKLNSEFEDLHLTESEKREIAENFLKYNRGFGVLDKLLADNDIDTVVVNSAGTVSVQSGGKFVKTELVVSARQFEEIFSRFGQNSALTRVTQDNFQITVMRPPVSDKMIVIRKINEVQDNFTDIKNSGLITEGTEKYLKDLIESRKNIILTGTCRRAINEFLQIFVNSISETLRVAVIEDNMPYRAVFDNVSSFSAASLKDFDWESFLTTVRELDFDYTVTSLADYGRLASYYLGVDGLASGLVTVIPADSPSAAASKLTDIAVQKLKFTEKQAKLKFSSLYDCVISVDELPDKKMVISTIMEITSTKSSSLVMDEVLRYLDGVYVQDFPIRGSDDEAVQEDAKPSGTFRSRLKPKNR